MAQRLLIIGGVITVCTIAALAVGQAVEAAKTERQIEALAHSASKNVERTVDFDTFSTLPQPVANYLKLALTDGQKWIKSASLEQAGKLRTSVTSENWSSFTANQLIVPTALGFIWNAKVELPLATHVRVLDSYREGAGSGAVSLLSVFTIDTETDVPELNSGALHRYLAEAVWYPTALLPESGVEWSPINEHSALATLTDRGITVALEFHFNHAGEIESIFSPGRFCKVDGGYERKAWEGHFHDYHPQSGMLVPKYGEVGWYEKGTLELVWQGSLIDATYELYE